VSDGWLFCAGSYEEQAAIGFFTAGSRLHDRPTAGTILARAAATPAIADLIGSPLCWKASSVVTRNAATTLLAASGGDNWIACGDALQTVDPIASSGTYLALKQAILAASIARETLAGDRLALRSYEISTRREFREILAERSAYYGLFRTASGAGGGDAAA
jgi:flavin-dependent dehydrogenase